MAGQIARRRDAADFAAAFAPEQHRATIRHFLGNVITADELNRKLGDAGAAEDVAAAFDSFVRGRSS